jgi:hypothetical protein
VVGIRHGCLEYRSIYDEHTARANRQPAATKEANRPLDTMRPWGIETVVETGTNGEHTGSRAN